MAKLHCILLICCLTSSCSLLDKWKKSPEPEPAVSPVPAPLILHDAVYKIRLAKDLPRLAATIAVDLPKAQAGYRWQFQLMTPNRELNDIQIILTDPTGKLPSLSLDQDSLANDEETAPNRSKQVASSGPYASIYRIEFLSPKQATAAQRISLVAQQVPSN